MSPEAGENPRLEVTPTAELPEDSLLRLLDLFRRSHRNADEAYLRRSLARLRYVATATSANELVAFALGDMRRMDLPRLPQQNVALAGICCVDPRFRRTGLFRRLEQLAFSGAGGWPAGRVLSCGRVAHPAAFRTISWNPHHVPRRGVRPSPWQQEVGSAIAAAYGVRRFDPETFVCIGDGRPGGIPVLDIDVDPEEWELFAPVDRERGDTLLGLCWIPDAPNGW